MPIKDANHIFCIGSNLEWFENQTSIRADAKGEDSILHYLKETEILFKAFGYKHPCCLERINLWKKRLSRYKIGEKIKINDAHDLAEDAEHWKDHFEEDLDLSYYWEIDPKGFTNPHFLLKEPRKFFEKLSNWSKITKLAQNDIKNACRCLCFELPTPAAFMFWRASEDTLRHYYKKKTKTLISGFIDWNKITRKLEKTGKVPQHIIDALDLIRNNYRNPVAHPDVTYAQKQTERLMHYAFGLIESMLNDIK